MGRSTLASVTTVATLASSNASFSFLRMPATYSSESAARHASWHCWEYSQNSQYEHFSGRTPSMAGSAITPAKRRRSRLQ